MTLTRSLAFGLLLASLAACTPWTRVDPTTRLESQRGLADFEAMAASLRFR